LYFMYNYQPIKEEEEGNIWNFTEKKREEIKQVSLLRVCGYVTS